MTMRAAIELSRVCQSTRYRHVDENVVHDIAKSMEHQGLLQPIGVQPCTCSAYQDAHYRLLFGAHRLEAARLLQWDTLDATVFDEALSDEMARLAELQENSARNDLTGSQRKQYAAEIGRLLCQLDEKSHSANGTDSWLIDLAQKTSTPRKTIYNWWNTFCREQGLTLTPRQALTMHQQHFFDWLESQHQQAEAEKAHKALQARQKRQDQECENAVEYLFSLAHEYGADVVTTAIIDVYYAQWAQSETPC